MSKTIAESDAIDAYWFAASDVLPHGDGRKIVIGETHSLTGETVLCEHALHASRQPFDALQYAPGPYLYRVRCWGSVKEKEGDKLGAQHRQYVAMIDATALLRDFARSQASSVLHLWKAPQIVKDYLATGDESSRGAAAAAATAAMETAARETAAAQAVRAARAARTARAAIWAAEAAARAAVWASRTVATVAWAAEIARASETARATRASETARATRASETASEFNALVEQAFTEGE